MKSEPTPTHNCPRFPLNRSTGIWTDFRYYVFNKPELPTLIEFANEKEREDYNHRILQRIGVNPNPYVILNLHRIGIEVPSKYVFEELEKWNGDSTCWPNHIAKVELKDGKNDNINLFLFGKKTYPFGLKKSFLGLKYIPLFDLSAFRVENPDHYELDNAKYLLYRCSGGYPIGIFSMFVRSSIEEYNENSTSQLFLLVGFNFWGKKSLTHIPLIRKTWEFIHNRVTNNIMNRFKVLCEWRFQQFLEREKAKSQSEQVLRP